METKSPFQQSAQPVYTGSAPLRLFKVEAGINGLLPTSWAPPIYSVSLLSKLCFALGGNGLLRQAAARSFLAHSCKRKNRPNQQKKPVRGLDNVGFIAASRLTQAGSNHAPCRFGHFGSPEGRKQNSPWASALGLDGVSEAHEALPDAKICGDARPNRKCRR